MQKIRRLTKKEYLSIYSKVPKLSVDPIIITKKGIILTKRTIEPAKGKWHIPGGLLLKGETIANGAKRLAKEELGIDIVTEKILGVIEYKFKNYKRQDIGIAILAHPKNENFKIKIDENADEFGVFKKFPKNMLLEQKILVQKYINIK